MIGRCLVTGGTGFIGSKLIKYLQYLDVEFAVLSRSIQSNVPTIVCDLIEDDIATVSLDGIDTVFHLAGIAHDLSNESELEDLYHAVNVRASVRLAENAALSGVKKLVFVSSVKAGGKGSSGKCLNESDQGIPEGIYGKTKREAEQMLLEVGEESDMQVSILRPTLVYGPNVKGNLKLMLVGIRNGWFPPLPDTCNRRSMIHIDDLVHAILLVAYDERTNGQIYIASDGKPHSSREIYETMCQLAGKKVPAWELPKFVFNLLGLLNPRIQYKVDKLLCDECFSSEKIESLGFKAMRTLSDMNETFF